MAQFELPASTLVARRSAVAIVLASVDSPVDRLNIASAVQGVAHVSFTRDPIAQIRDGESSRPRAFLVELSTSVTSSGSQLIRDIRGYDALTPVIAYGTLQPGLSGQLISAVRAGAEYLILKGYDDVRRVISDALEHEQRARVTASVVALLNRPTPKMASAIIDCCVVRAANPPTVDELAAHVGVHRRTLARQLFAFGLPSAEAMIGWGRILLAASLIEETRAPIEAIALKLGFLSVSAFRTMFKRYTGFGPSDASQAGGFAATVHCFGVACERRKV
jgi:AraC-like DNA-binding protein